MTYVQRNLRNKTTIRVMKSGLIFEVVLIPRTIIHVYTDLGLHQSGLIIEVVLLYRWSFSGVSLYLHKLTLLAQS